MISDSNEQLHQEFEYTLQKPDYTAGEFQKCNLDVRALLKNDMQSVRDDERCGRNKEVNTPELIGEKIRVMINMLRFYRSSGKDS